MLGFKGKLKQLLAENSLSPEKLANRLPDNKKISASTIRNYLKGVPPKGQENYEILADYFGVSVQYLYDDNVSNRNFENIEMGKEIGLSDKAIQNLRRLKTERDTKMLETINLLLEEEELKSSSLLGIINLYLNIEIPEKEENSKIENNYDDFEIIFEFKSEDFYIRALLDIQNDKLKELRKEIQLQNNNN